MAKTLIYTERRKRSEYQQAWDEHKENVQKVVDCYNATKLPALNGDELGYLFGDPVNFLHDKITGKKATHIKIGKEADNQYMEINRQDAIRMSVKPDGYEELLEAIKTAGGAFARGISKGYEGPKVCVPQSSVNSYFVVDKKGCVTLTESVNNKIADMGNYYVETIACNKMVNFTKAVIAAYFDNDIPSLKRHFPNPTIQLIIDRTLEAVNVDNKTFTFKKDLSDFDRNIQSLGGY